MLLIALPQIGSFDETMRLNYKLENKERLTNVLYTNKVLKKALDMFDEGYYLAYVCWE